MPGALTIDQLRTFIAAVQPLRDGRCRIAVTGSLPDIPQGCASDYLSAIPSATVAAPGHPLAKIKGTVSRVELSKHVQPGSPTVPR